MPSDNIPPSDAQYEANHEDNVRQAYWQQKAWGDGKNRLREEQENESGGSDDWTPLDMEQLLDGAKPGGITPTRLVTDDGVPLLYEKTDWGWGESGAGKTLLRLYETSRELKQEHRVIWIDLEQAAEHAANATYLFGVPRSNVLEFFTIIQPHGPLTTRNRLHIDSLLGKGVALLVIDAANGIVTLQEGRPNDDDAIYDMERKLLDPAIEAGCAPRIIDHVTKNSVTRDWPKNSGRKRDASFTGISIDIVSPFSKTEDGYSQITCYKDRNGTWANSQVIGYLSVEKGRFSLTHGRPSLGVMPSAAKKSGSETEKLGVVVRLLLREHTAVTSINALAQLILEKYQDAYGKDSKVRINLGQLKAEGKLVKENGFFIWKDDSGV